MLILGRKPGESVVVVLEGKQEIEIKVVRNERGQVGLGFQADDKYKFVRKELLKADAKQRSR